VPCTAAFAQQGDQLAVNTRVAGQAFVLVQEVRFTGEVADQTAGFGYQQGAGCNVPGLQSGFKKSVSETRRNIGQIERGSTRATQAGRALHHVAHHAQVVVEVVAGAEGETGRDQALLQLDTLGDAQSAVVHVGTASFGGSEQVVAARVVNHGLFDFALDRQGDADAVHRQAVNKVGGAVQRVDDPDKFRVFGAVLLARFFGQDAVTGVGSQQCLDDDLFGCVVNIGYEVIDQFLRNADRLHIQRGAVDDGAGGSGRLDGDVDHGMQIGGHESLFGLWTELWLYPFSGCHAGLDPASMDCGC
jgi:hypothetical protein